MSDLFFIIKRYDGLLNKVFVLVKWFIFPFKKMEEYLPVEGEVVDIGCGEGVLTIYLALKSKKRRVYGIDLDKRRIVLAKKAAFELKNIRFLLEDALLWRKKVDAIVVSDVFHHFLPTDQENFLEKAYKLLRKNGILVIKEINRDDVIRSKLSRFWDYLLYPADSVNYWSTKKLVRKLKTLGFQVDFFRASVLFPGSTIVYICSKK